MAYSYQTWSYGTGVTSTKMQQLEDNVRDHSHGSGGVNATMGSVSVIGDITVNKRVHCFSNHNISVFYGRIPTISGSSVAPRLPTYPVTWTVSYNGVSSNVIVTHSLQVPTDALGNVKATVQAQWARFVDAHLQAHAIHINANQFQIITWNALGSADASGGGFSFWYAPDA